MLLMLLQSSSRNKNKSHFKNVNCAVGLAGAPEYELDPSREENLQPSYTKHEACLSQIHGIPL